MRASGSYESLIRGVSQQVPHDRQVGQHSEQVNMLPDPVNGLTRRHGSTLVAERKYPLLSVDDFEAYVEDSNSFRTFEHSQGGNDYVIICRTAARVEGDEGRLPLLVVFNKTTNQWANMNRNAVDAKADQLDAGGISAGVAIGNYFLMAGNTVPTSGSEIDRWNNLSNLDKSVIWIRGGAYSRTYRGSFRKHDGTVISGTYTTPSSAYPGVLDTSDIAASDPEYTKKVNDRVNAYNAAVTQWIGTSTAAIQPQAIAAALAALFAEPGVTAVANGSHVVFTGIRSMTVDDGGDGSLVAGVADEVESVDKLSLRHYAGKVVKVRTRNTENAFYMKAVPKDRAVADGTVTEVTWVECAGNEWKIEQALFFATMQGNEVYYASTPALLNALFPGDHPDYAVSTAGDRVSNPLPYATNRLITYLGVFQDRLLVGSGGTVLCSKIGDYLNWFRTTMLTTPADDAFEMRAQGPDDDTLRHSVLYDQSLVLFGDRRQYVISGKVALAPSSANMAVMSAYAGTASSPPHVAGGLIFYAKPGETFSSVNEIQPGRGLQNSPESFPASSQIDSYLAGRVIEFTSNAEPSTLFVRTTGARNSVYTFFYVDGPEGRKVDAWSRWDFDPALGVICGMTPTDEGVHLYFLRKGHDGMYAVTDLCTLTTGLSTRPYLDSQRPWADVELAIGSVRPTTTGPWYAAFDYTAGAAQWLGSNLEDANAMETTYPGVTGLTVGAQQAAYVEITNPYMRDNNTKAILSGRLTITNMLIATADSAGFKSTVDVGGVQSVMTFTGRVIGEPTAVGVEHISTGKYTIPIGRETRAYSLRLAARSWLPFTVTAIEWSGQYFNRTQRFT